MSTPIAVDWSTLIHAFGPATNIPGYVADWRGTNPRRKIDGETYLRNSCFAHGLWPATAPTTVILAEFLNNPDLDGDDAHLPLLFIDRIARECDFNTDTDATRAAVAAHADQIASWITAYATADHDEQDRLRRDQAQSARLLHEQSALACCDLIPQLLPTVMPWLTDTRIRRRAWIAATITAMARHPALTGARRMLTADIERAASAEADPHELATLLIALGDLGVAPRAWLDHHHLGVRISAAIASGLAGDDTVAPVLEVAAQDPAAYFASFGDVAPPAQFMTPPHGRDVLSQALQRVDGDVR